MGGAFRIVRAPVLLLLNAVSGIVELVRKERPGPIECQTQRVPIG